MDEIMVTGTRLRRTDGMAEPTPVTTLELQMFEPGSTIAEQLDALPQFFSTGTAQRGAPALFGDGGGSYLNMRGLGRDRTLVLFDGSRVVPADKRGQVNVDTLPTALVRSVDVVTGGASAAYGADALGGVTNFILDREFQGLKFSASTGVNDFNNDGKKKLERVGRRRHANRWSHQHHRLDRDPARGRDQSQSGRSRYELVPALGLYPKPGLERERSSGHEPAADHRALACAACRARQRLDRPSIRRAGDERLVPNALHR
jgi:hypothetical protein